MTEDELFARRPMGMRMAMVGAPVAAIIDAAITDTGLDAIKLDGTNAAVSTGRQRLGQ